MFSDFRFALRSLWRNPSFAAVAALSIALGIGANTAMFSLADAMLLRPVPVPHPSALLNLRSQLRGRGPGSMSYPDYVDFRAKTRAFSGPRPKSKVLSAKVDAGFASESTTK